jgi:Zn finger protein HypA/HybF involved in hydrogenase expression
MMDIKTKFDLGDNVIALSSMWATRKVFCLTCEQTGKVNILGESFICPKCHGACLRDNHCGHKTFIAEESRIGKIEIQLLDEKYCYHGHVPYKVQYMIESTGVVSGTLWNEKDLFATRKEAQAECDKRNAKLILVDDVLKT